MAEAASQRTGDAITVATLIRETSERAHPVDWYQPRPTDVQAETAFDAAYRNAGRLPGASTVRVITAIVVAIIFLLICLASLIAAKVTAHVRSLSNAHTYAGAPAGDRVGAVARPPHTITVTPAP